MSDLRKKVMEKIAKRRESRGDTNKSPLGSGETFRKLKSELPKKGTKDPGALPAWKERLRVKE